MLEGTTNSGFKFKVDERALTDWRFVTALSTLSSASDDSDILNNTINCIDFILGKDKEKLLKHVSKLNDGFMPAEKVIQEFSEIVTTCKELKNL